MIANFKKSHFQFSQSQRNGIFLLIGLIVIFQCVYFYVDAATPEIAVNEKKLAKFQREVDSLKLAAIEKSKSIIFPFNPNFITDYKGYTLGLNNEEIDRLLAFREQDKWINSTTQFQEVTMISDSLLNILSPYFKFPDWVNSTKPKTNWVDYSKTINPQAYAIKTYLQKLDLNKVSAIELQKVNGVGEKLSDNIIRLRNKFVGGFIADIQLQDVYGLSPEVIERITNDFTVKTPRIVEKININTGSKDQLVTIQHIDYEIAHYIIEQRTLRDGFKTWDELIKVKNFPIGKIEIIKLYLTLN